MQRTLAALKVCRRIMDRHRVGPRPLRRHRGVPPRQQRARVHPPGTARGRHRARGAGPRRGGPTGHAGLPAPDRPEADRLLMLDIGGGSTEIMWLDRREPRTGSEPGYTPVHAVGRGDAFGDLRRRQRRAGLRAMVAHAVERLAEANRLPASAHARQARPADAGHIGHGHHPGRGASGPAALRPAQGRRHLPAVHGDPVRVPRAARARRCRPRRAPLHRPRPGRPRRRRLRHPRRRPSLLAGRAPAGRRPRPARGHPQRAAGPPLRQALLPADAFA